ncbi:hypothetical protein NLI96_g2490 [Meripilus lineatus]|uniref:Calcineurin-like phosphoesterase domain-containing protein n=1 Tax=Meripilus lineatus TaxID=2056292 RepID=A0AAD5YLU1_9APHY|nr:hypothetical protein NLI96_g2490 [Physisporinus lineatus]
MFIPATRRRTLLRLSSRMSLVSFLRIIWVFWVFWFEHGIFYYTLWGCRWPKLSSSQPVKPTHVLLLSDSQVRYTPTNGRHRWSDDIRRLLYHITIRKNWNYASSMKPDAVVFLGDMLASGSRVTRDDEYDQYYRMFKYLFPVPKSVSVYYTPGNEDLGLRTDLRTAHAARYHYDQYFGSANSRISITNHTFVMLDSPGLVEEDYIRDEHHTEYEHWTPLEGGAIEHVRKAYSQSADADGDSHHPTILFSHIPLSRPDTASCGPLREKGSIRRGVGVGYQNTLGKKTTNWLFQNIRPCIIFSGDDRDYCDYSHQISSYLDIEDPAHPSVREVTVKSFSPVKYVRNPGFHLLTLVPPRQSHSDKSFKTFADSPCLLPAHLSHYRSHYLPFTFLTFIVLVLSHYRNRKQGRTPLSLRNGSLPTYYQSHQDFATSEDVTPESETWHLLEPEDLTEFPNNPYDTYSAGTGSRLSPRDPLPPTLRTPSSQAPKGLKSTTSDGGFYSVGLNTATPTTPTFRASIHSAAPIQSGFLSSSSNSVENTDQENDEDEDHMCPSYSQPPPSRSHSRRSILTYDIFLLPPVRHACLFGHLISPSSTPPNIIPPSAQSLASKIPKCRMVHPILELRPQKPKTPNDGFVPVILEISVLELYPLQPTSAAPEECELVFGLFDLSSEETRWHDTRDVG